MQIKEQVGTVYETNDYSQFKKLKGNRDVTEEHVQMLMKSFKQGDVKKPIVVNEKMEIIDGQARLEVKKRLGLPVQFVIAEGATIDDVRRMNR